MNNLIEFISFIWKKELVLDKSIYLTVILGQLTIYGIFLTFMQFVATLNGDNSIKTYLGKDLKQFYMIKKLKFYRIIRSRWFLYLMIISILLKPFMTIFTSIINTEVNRILLFNWYFFNVIFLLIFMYSFFECVILSIGFMDFGQGLYNSEVLEEIEQEFLSNKRFKNKAYSCDKLADEMDYILYERKKNNEILDKCYQRFIPKLIEIYIDKKLDALSSKKQIKEYQGYQYIFSTENQVLDDLIRVFIHDKEFLLKLSKYKLYLINIYYNKYGDEDCESTFPPNLGIINGSIWEVYKEIYKHNKDLDILNYIVEQLDPRVSNNGNQSQLFKTEMRKVLGYLLCMIIEDIYTFNINEQQLVDAFTEIFSKEYFKQMIMREISGRYVSNETFKPSKILDLLDEKHKTFIFIHNFFYISIYNNYSERIGQSFGHFRKLLPKINDLYESIEENKSYLLKELSSKMDMYKFYPEMLDKLIEYLKYPMSFALLKQIEQDKVLSSNLFIPLRLYVLDESISYPYEKDVFDKRSRSQINIINYLVAHPEFLVNQNIQELIYYLQINLYQKEDCFLIEFEKSLSHLILANVLVTDEILLKWRKDNKYINADLAKYILVKITDLNRCISPILLDWVFKFIIQDFIRSDKSVLRYVEDINKVYLRYQFPLVFFQKKKMMYLLKRYSNIMMISN